MILVSHPVYYLSSRIVLKTPDSQKYEIFITPAFQ